MIDLIGEAKKQKGGSDVTPSPSGQNNNTQTTTTISGQTDLVSMARQQNSSANTSTSANYNSNASANTSNSKDWVTKEEANQKQTWNTGKVGEGYDKELWAKYGDSSYGIGSSGKKKIKEAYKELKDMGMYGDTYSQREKWQKAIAKGKVDLDYAEAVSKAYDAHSIEGAVFSFIEGLGSVPHKLGTSVGALGEAIGNKINGTNNHEWKDASANREEAIAESKEAHPIATGAGQFAGNMVGYQAVNGAIGEGASTIGNLLRGQLADTIMDTVPTITTNALEGKYKNADGSINWKDAVTDTALNQGSNLLYNVGAESVPFIIDALKGVDAGDALKNAMKNSGEDIKALENINFKNAVNDVKNGAKSAKNVINDNVVDAVKNADEVVDATKSADSIADSVKTAENVVEEPKLQSFEELISEGAKTEPTQQIPTLDLDYETKHLQSQKQVWESLRSQLGDELGDENFKMLMGDDALNPEEYFKSAEEYLDSVRKGTDIDVPDITKEVTNTVEESVPEVAKQTEIPKIEEPKQIADTVEEPAEYLGLDKYAKANNVEGEAGFEPPNKLNSDVGNARHIGDKVSKARTNTLENSGILSKEELDKIYFDEKAFTYDSTTEKESVLGAISDIVQDPNGHYENLMKMDVKNASNKDIDSLFIYFRNISEKARLAEAEGLTKEAEDLWNQASETFKKIQEIGTSRGQDLQAFAKWSRNTTEGMLSETFREVEQRVKKEFGEKIAKDVVDKLSKEDMSKIKSILDEVVNMDINSREAKLKLAEIGKIVDYRMPKTIRGRVTTILMDNMLGNFRTLISRNAGGNVGYNAMEFLRQPITASADYVTSKFTGKRTRTGWSADKISSYFDGMVKGLKEEADDLAKGVHTAKDGDNTIANAIGLNQHSFSYNHNTKSETVNKVLNASGKAINKIDDMVKHGLSVGDRPFYEAAYEQRIAELNDLYNRKLLGEEVQNLTKEQFDKIAELSAKTDGLVATYQNNGVGADSLTRLKQFASDTSKTLVGVDLLSQFSTPFVRTPGNIMERAIEYSPLGFVKNMGETFSDKVRGKDFNQQRFVDEFGRSVLGTSGLVGATALYNAGVTNGSYSNDEAMKQAQKDQGMIEYGVNLPIGEYGANVDLSFMPVVGTILTEGAAIGENKKNNPDATFLDNLISGSGALVDTLVDSSAMQGAQRLLGGTNSYSSDGFFGNIKNTAESGLGQLVPSWLRQDAAIADDYQRNISNGDNSYTINNIISSIPYLRENELEPKIDSEGNYALQNQGRGILSKIFENKVLPGTYKEYTPSDLRDEQMRLYETSLGEDKQFGGEAQRKDITTEDFTPSDKDYTSYLQDYRKASSQAQSYIISSNFYKNLSDADKIEVLSAVNSAAKTYAKENTIDGYEGKNNLTNAYRENNAQGMLDYLSENYNTIQKKNDFKKYDIDTSNLGANNLYKIYGDYGLKVYSEIKNSSANNNANVTSITEYAYENNLDPYTAGKYLYLIIGEKGLAKASLENFDGKNYDVLYEHYLNKYYPEANNNK